MKTKGIGNSFSLLSKVDFLGYKPELLYNKELGHSSNYGGAVTILAAMLYLLTAIFTLWRILQKESPETNVNRLYIKDPTGFTINKDTLPFAFGIQDVNGVHCINSSIYTIDATYKRSTNTMVNGTVEILGLSYQRPKEPLCSSSVVIRWVLI